MELPAVLRAENFTLARSIVAGGAPGRQANKLLMTVEQQLQRNWCWAAVSRSISLFYDASSTWTQCSIASTTLGRSDCCGSGASDDNKCNKPWYLDRALATTSNFVSFVATAAGASHPMTYDEIRTEIDNGKPIATRIKWFGGGGHFQVITGWEITPSGEEYITVWDPIYFDTDILYADFASRYHGAELWSHAYFTTPPVSRLVAGGSLQEADNDELIGA